VTSSGNSAEGEPKAGAGWRGERSTGIAAIAIGTTVAAAMWLALRYLVAPIPHMETLAARMMFALKCCCFATLFCLVTGIEAVAHERLQSPAFDPLAGHQTRRLAVNLRYLQNTLEQLAVFSVGLFGLAAYSPDGSSMRAVLATTMVWLASRFAFWIGYHRSAALRGLGAPGMAAGLLMLLYVVARISFELAGKAGAAAAVGAFLLIEALLFWKTRSRG
jgi:hypothetical protein